MATTWPHIGPASVTSWPVIRQRLFQCWGPRWATQPLRAGCPPHCREVRSALRSGAQAAAVARACALRGAQRASVQRASGAAFPNARRETSSLDLSATLLDRVRCARVFNLFRLFFQSACIYFVLAFCISLFGACMSCLDAFIYLCISFCRSCLSVIIHVCLLLCTSVVISLFVRSLLSLLLLIIIFVFLCFLSWEKSATTHLSVFLCPALLFLVIYLFLSFLLHRCVCFGCSLFRSLFVQRMFART